MREAPAKKMAQEETLFDIMYRAYTTMNSASHESHDKHLARLPNNAHKIRVNGACLIWFRRIIEIQA